MSRIDNEQTEKKPMPVPCETCGAATEHDRRLCAYCEAKLPPRQAEVKLGDYKLEGVEKISVRDSAAGSDGFGAFDAFDLIYLAASRAAFRRRRRGI